ncbi:transporter substrate-binding domain-containing protein [Pseudomonas sp. UL073]|uniref:Transporter substrate-binding domain-containing protein n=1 Tax=Zestomonas insulae TaxID=2809017 RepID=A0ABS2IB68_9GAMM|nr:transporter substrate-binding domain-containing protein [Pseudomonas insulae]MBM7060366.1 transporter substrate-binding domain-containing protein [Pseudomonas insulae]
MRMNASAAPPLRRWHWLLVPLLGSLLAAVQADEVAHGYGCDRPIRLALYENRVFYHDAQGIDPDLVAELRRRSGCAFEVSVMPRSDIWRALQAGTLDMATSGIATPERERFAYFVPYLYLRNKLIVPASLAPQLVSMSDFVQMPGARLGIIASYRHGPFMDSSVRILRLAGRVSEYPDEATRFRALASGEVSALIGHDLNLDGAVPAAERLNYRLVDVAPGPAIPHGLVLARAHFSAPQAAQWLRLIEAMRLDGRLAGIMRANAPQPAADELLNSGYHYELAKQGRQP